MGAKTAIIEELDRNYVAISEECNALEKCLGATFAVRAFRIVFVSKKTVAEDFMKLDDQEFLSDAIVMNVALNKTDCCCSQTQGCC